MTKSYGKIQESLDDCYEGEGFSSLWVGFGELGGREEVGR